MVEILFVLALIGALGGAASGVLWNGYEGLLLGGSIGLVSSVLCWTLLYALARINTPQRLDAHIIDHDSGSPS